MTNVTALTMELVEQFEFAVGRRVTAAEYMELRKQAIFELSSGYSIPGMQPDIMRPVIPDANIQNANDYAPNYTSTAATGAVTAMPVTQGTIPMQEQKPPTSVVNNSATKPSAATVIPSTNVATTEKQGVAQMMPSDATTTADNENNDFFKLVGKFM